jgi:two-component system sensor histidine kinase ChiS
LINNYLDEHLKKYGGTPELKIIKYNIQRLTTDVINFFDLERFNKGFITYDHHQVCDFSGILKVTNWICFRIASKKKLIELEATIESGVYTKADPSAIERIVNNLIENAVKYSLEGARITIRLFSKGSTFTSW